MWNCSGVRVSSSAQEKVDFLWSNISGPWDILILIETHHKMIEDIQPVLYTYKNNYHMMHTEAEEVDSYAGIVVFVHNRFKVEDENILLVGRLLKFTLITPKSTYHISIMYGYTGNSATRSKMELFTEKILSSHKRNDKNLILGDFNFVDNDLDRVSATRVGQNQSDKTLEQPWLHTIAELDLEDPFRFKNPRRKMFSYVHTANKSKSRLDRLYVTSSILNNIISYKHTQTPFTKAHKVLSFTVKENVERGPSFWKMNTSRLTDRAYQTMVENTIQDVNNLHLQDPIERWLIFIETIRIESKAYCKRKRYHERAIKDLCERNIATLEQNQLLPVSKSLNSQYEYYRALLNKWTADQISGYQTRIKAQPKFEPGEPNISFFANMEKKTGNRKNITELQDINGELQYETVALKEIAVDYYKELFSEKKTDTTATQKLLQNVKNKISLEQRASLDEGITLEELEKTVKKLQKGKSPGPDGIPAEFYQSFWDKIQTMYHDFINAVKRSCFPANKNVSITTLIFKEKGERCSLKNYRPIALMNVDIKILTKLLSLRLNLVLPTIIHESQTAVYGRVIGDNINLIRDLIDLSNKNEEEAALLFLDQEKAFDRVSHNVMLKTLKHFGFGPNFISWIEILYSNASTRVDVNGFLTEKVQLKSGVRQGCPLSPLLYVLIIELLGLLLRSNQNIVGFQIEGDRLISSHYSDDAVIKITQNRCFKEVYKDLTTYENGTGARINYDKTKGLWLGKWKGRKDDPFEGINRNPNQQIKWTSTNVKYLGVYVGNNNPDLCTFQEIIPKVKKRLHYWKPLSLPILSKSRVIEIFHASKLWYAASIYPIPSHFTKDLNDALMDYIVFPKNKAEVNKMEMEKEGAFGRS